MKEQAEEARKKLVPNKSADRYQKEYEIFKNWQQTNNVTEVDEDVILAYVSEFVSDNVCCTTNPLNLIFI